MGCRLSCRRSGAGNFAGVRVVHANGYVEDLRGPVTVGEVTGKPPKLMCFAPAQLLSFVARPLGLEERLEPGSIYLLLPHTVLQTDSSPADLAALAGRLTALARRGGGQVKDSAAAGGSELGGAAAGESGRGVPSKMRPWRPILETIEESFRRATEDRSCSPGMYSKLGAEEHQKETGLLPPGYPSGGC